MKKEEIGVRVRYAQLGYVSPVTNSRDSWVVEKLDGKRWKHWHQLLYRDMAIESAVRILQGEPQP